MWDSCERRKADLVVSALPISAAPGCALPHGWVEVKPGLYWRRALPGAGYAAVALDLDSLTSRAMFYAHVCPITGPAFERRADSLAAAIALADGLICGRRPSVAEHCHRRLLATAGVCSGSVQTLARRAM